MLILLRGKLVMILPSLKAAVGAEAVSRDKERHFTVMRSQLIK